MWVAIVAAVLALAGAVGWRLRDRELARASLEPARTVRPRQGILERTVRLSGEVRAERTAAIVAPKLRGTRRRGISDFSMALQSLIKPGVLVKPGDVVAEFDQRAMEVRLDDYRADVEDRRSIVRRVQASLDSRRAALEQRIRVAEGAVAKARLNMKTIPVRSAIVAERFRLHLEEALAHVRELRKQAEFFDVSERSELRRQMLALREEELELKRAETNRDKMALRAPIEGVVVLGQIQKGAEYVEIGQGDEIRPGYVFLQVIDMRDMVLEAIANQIDVQRVSAGAKATVGIDAMPGVRIPARVSAVGTIAASRQYRPDFVRQVVVRLKLDRTPVTVHANSSAYADVVLESVHADAILPRHCVAADGSVRVRRGEGWHNVPVVTGAANHVEVVVRDGLAENEIVACEP